MKTFVLSADDMQQFTKLIYDQQKTAATIAAVTQMEQNHALFNVSSNGNIAYHNQNINNNNELQQQQQHQLQQQQQQQQQQHQQQTTLPTAAHLMSLQYYLKQPTAPPIITNGSTGLVVNNNNNNNTSNVNYPTTTTTTVIQQSHQLQTPQTQQQQQQQQLQNHNSYHQQQQNLIAHTQHHNTHLQQQQQQHHQQPLPPQQIPNISHLRIKQPNGQASKMLNQHQQQNQHHHHHHSHHHHSIANSYNHAHHPYYAAASGLKQYTNVSSAAAHLLKTITTSTATATAGLQPKTAATHGLPRPAHVNNGILVSTSQRQQQKQQHHQQHSNQTTTTTNVPVHALNQNSNFSAASSSTGGGTNSSHAPTQQSNTTGPSLSPPAAVSANPRTQQTSSSSSAMINKNHTNSNATTAATTTIIPPPRYTIVNPTPSLSTIVTPSNCKKIKIEPELSETYKSERLNFANAHLTWSEEHWCRLLIQDERKFNLDGPDGYSNYYHDLRNNERILSQRPRGNSVYIYLLITSAGPIHIEVSTAKIGADCIIDTLLRQRSTIINKLGNNGDFLLQDHNWTTTASPSIQELLNSEGIKSQKWPTIAHDMNIMENIWGWIIREVYDGGRKFSRKDDLIFRIREAWTRLPIDLIRNLYSTLPERIMELYLTLGAYTNC